MDRSEADASDRVGMTGTRVGFGDRPAVVVVDLQTGLTRPSSPLGADLSAVVAGTNRLTGAATDADVPVVYTRHVPYPDGRRIGIWRKIEDLAVLNPDRETGRLDDRLDVPEKSLVLDKHQADAFHETCLDSLLTERGVDTVIVAGCSTSGCVRATALGACSRGYRTIVPEPCVGDRSAEQHRANLDDIAVRIGDVVPADRALAYLRSRGDASAG